MPKWAFGIIATSVSLLGEAGLQMSGIQSMTLAVILWVFAGIGVLYLILALPPIAKRIPLPFLKMLVTTTEKKTASQIHDIEVGEHISKIKNVLETWKQQLSEMIKQEKIADLQTNIEIEMVNKNDFWYLLMHCPSLDKEYEDLRGQREIYKMHLHPIIEKNGKTVKIKPKKVDIIEQKKYLNKDIRSLVEVIDHSLSSYEYSRYKCPLCPHNMTKS